MTGETDVVLLHAGVHFMKDIANVSSKNVRIVSPVLQSKVLRALRRIHLKIFPIYRSVWVNQVLKKSKINDSPTTLIVIFDVEVWLLNLSYIRFLYPRSRIVVWYWNLVKNESLLSHVKKENIPIVTFDHQDSIRYCLEYHPQFYWNTELKDKFSEENCYDVIYVGRSKGRLRQLESLYNEFEKSGLNVFFYVVGDSGDSSKILKMHDSFLTYDKVVDICRKCKVILEVNFSNQTGMSLRALEALFLDKKLITTNAAIINEPFYNNGNVLLLQEPFDDSIDSIEAFLYAPIQTVPENVKKKYTVDSWLDAIENIAR